MSNTFQDLGLATDLLKALKDIGFVNPTPIQEKGIPFLLKNSGDLVAIAQTGTGKTAAFGLPILQSIDVSNPKTQALVLSPTRELGLQIASDLTNFSKYIDGLNVVAVYGGASMEGQIKSLSKAAQVVVATPGRACDLIRRNKLKLQNVMKVVLDEADEMLSMGFQEDLEFILSKTDNERQVILFSATFSKEIEGIAKKYMKNSTRVEMESKQLTATNIQHVYYQVKERNKYHLLKRIVDLHPDIYGIIFCRTRNDTQTIAAKLLEDGYSSGALHGDMSQAQRDDMMKKFRQGSVQLLVATDVAARGLDVDDLTHVINYSLPEMPETYVHRSGRTARAGKEGVSIAIVNQREGNRLRSVEKHIKTKFIQKVAPSGQEVCQAQLFNFIKKIEETQINESQIEPFMPVVLKAFEGLDKEQVIKQFVSAEFNRFLDYYKNASNLNLRPDEVDTNEDDRNSRRSKGKKRRGESNSQFVELYINIGKKNNLNPGRLMGVINEALNHNKAQIGRIKIDNKHTFFEIEEGTSSKLISSLNGSTFGSVKLFVEKTSSRNNGRKGR